MNDEAIMKKTLKEVLEGPDNELLQIVFLLSKEARRRSSEKMKDPAYRSQVQAGIRHIFQVKDQGSKL